MRNAMLFIAASCFAFFEMAAFVRQVPEVPDELVMSCLLAFAAIAYAICSKDLRVSRKRRG